MNVASRLPDTSAAALADRSNASTRPPFLGFGLGLRAQHYDEILNGNPPIDWFEVISENYMLPGGQPLRILDRICARYPVVMHGVSMSIASTAAQLRIPAGAEGSRQRVEPKWVSDHRAGPAYTAEPATCCRPLHQEALDHVVSRVQRCRIFSAIPSCSRTFNLRAIQQFEMTEWEFCRTFPPFGCWLLFDVNNVYVSAFNHGTTR
jgi:uncharacterized protein (UPF0276 family)